jgi:hypothetical protein
MRHTDASHIVGTKEQNKNEEVASMDLGFPELNGSPVQGLNDAGLEIFLGAINEYVSRECGQNTGDAVCPGVHTAQLECDRVAMPAKENPSRFVPVESQDVSSKGDSACGSCGIGKRHPFAAARFRTVFYGTWTESGAVALQGVSYRATHKGTNARIAQGVGCIREYDRNGGRAEDLIFRVIRDESRIRAISRRNKPGTDIWVISHRSGGEWSTPNLGAALCRRKFLSR